MDTVPTKQCTKCGQRKPLTPEFWQRARAKKDGWKSRCKACRRQDYSAYHAQHPEKAAARKRRQHERNPEAREIYRQRYKERHPERLLESYRRYHAKNRDRRNREAAAYRAAKPAKMASLQREWERRNPERVRARRQNRRARALGATGRYTAEDVQRQRTAQKNRCWWCGKRMTGDAHADHLIPLARGGSNGPENIVVTHPQCNTRKGVRLPWEFMEGRLL